MTIDRRLFVAGLLTSASAIVLSACTPSPSPRPTGSVSPAPVPTPTTTAVPAPSAFVRTSWSSDPYAFGSTSYLPVGATPEHRSDLAQNVDDRVFFAGEATDADAPGTVEGAYASGVRAAGEIAAIAADAEKIVVIGAGLAGAVAARRLTDAGYDVIVFESRGRVGGRIATSTPDGWPVAVDAGAFWFTDSSSTTLASALADANVRTSEIDLAVSAFDADGADVDLGDSGEKAIANAVTWAGEQPLDLPLAEALTGAGAADPATAEPGDGVNDADRVAAALAAGPALEQGAGADTLSGWYALGDPFSAGAGAGAEAEAEAEAEATADPAAAPVARYAPDGLGSLVSSLLTDVEVSLKTVATSVQYDEDGISIRLSTGESFSADRVLVSVPLGVLKTDALSFDPPLPFAHRTAIGALGMGAVDTLWLRFDEPFWSTDAVRWSLVDTDSALTQWLNLEPLTGEPVLVALLGADAALAVAQLSDDEVLTSVTAALAPFARAAE